MRKINNTMNDTINKSESKIQAEIVQWLQDNGYYFASFPNEGSLDKVRTMRLIGMGLRPGAADLVVIKYGKVVFLEVKTPDGVQSDKQKKFEAKVKELDHDYFIVRSVEDVKECLT